MLCPVHLPSKKRSHLSNLNSKVLPNLQTANSSISILLWVPLRHGQHIKVQLLRAQPSELFHLAIMNGILGQHDNLKSTCTGVAKVLEVKQKRAIGERVAVIPPAPKSTVKWPLDTSEPEFFKFEPGKPLSNRALESGNASLIRGGADVTVKKLAFYVLLEYDIDRRGWDNWP